MSVFEEEKRKKRLKAETEEKLDVLGQNSDLKALPWVEKEVEAEEKIEADFMQNSLMMLGSFKKRLHYIRYLTQIFLHHAADEGIPRKYRVEVEANDIGLIVKIGGTHYVGAFKASGLPSYDFHACKLMAVRLGNTIAKLEGYVPTTEGGIVLPDKEDVKKYGTR